ncbi:hypothetical protein [Bdellovibrio bacteriovorus]|uniref:hypothetical protein n=1 Tax=Bdellovibrio bacteriovorus TaxID=959 RepID=UPI0035A6040C
MSKCFRRFLKIAFSLVLIISSSSCTTFKKSAEPLRDPAGGELSSAYSFGGACSSQGAWTQAALSVTQNLRRVTLQLKDDANCKALGNSVQTAISQISEQVQSASDTEARAARLSQIPAEIGALRSFAKSSTSTQASVLRLMMDRSIEGVTLSAQVEADSRSRSSHQSMTDGLLDFGTRTRRSTQSGLKLLNQVVDSIPQLDECLTGDDQAALGAYLSGAVQMTASFLSSGQGIGSDLATTISKLTGLIRDRKYSKVLRKLNQQEFLSSMTCLLEVTSESYCQARDGMSLYLEGIKELPVRGQDKTILKNSKPFAGYYILNTHVPNVTRWMQKIQIGVDPKLPTDADFQVKILQEVSEFHQGVKKLQGDYNTALGTIKRMPSLEAKQNGVYNLIKQVTERMVGGKFERNENTNFFTLGKNPLRVPFFLIGMHEVPDQVSGKAMPKLDYDEWLQMKMSELPMFNDPVGLAEAIGKNMDDLIHEAQMATIEYFNQWYIVDKSALVNESTVDVNYTVKDSFIAIDGYLDQLLQRIEKYNGDKTIVSTLIDTRARIGKVLTKYAELESIGKKLNSKSKLNDEDLKKNAEAFENLINVVYDQFEVMLARSGFLANRMVTFVYQDYILLLKNNVRFSESQKDLFIATGMAAFDRLLQIYNGNPANIQTDLNMALRLNKGNIEALEVLLKDHVISNIAELKMIEEGKSTTDFSVRANSYMRFWKDYFGSHKYLYGLGILGQYQVLKQYYQHSDRYPLTARNGGDSASPQSEFDDVTALRAQLCIQALAFNDQKSLKSLCDGVVLQGPPYQDHRGYAVSYSEKLSVYLKDKRVTEAKRKALNHSERICAFRDYQRKNMVVYMTSGQK